MALLGQCWDCFGLCQYTMGHFSSSEFGAHTRTAPMEEKSGLVARRPVTGSAGVCSNPVFEGGSFLHGEEKFLATRFRPREWQTWVRFPLSMMDLPPPPPPSLPSHIGSSNIGTAVASLTKKNMALLGQCWDCFGRCQYTIGHFTSSEFGAHTRTAPKEKKSGLVARCPVTRSAGVCSNPVFEGGSFLHGEENFLAARCRQSWVRFPLSMMDLPPPPPRPRPPSEFVAHTRTAPMKKKTGLVARRPVTGSAGVCSNPVFEGGSFLHGEEKFLAVRCRQSWVRFPISMMDLPPPSPPPPTPSPPTSGPQILVLQ